MECTANPLDTYKKYHKSKINNFIHIISVPIIFTTILTLIEKKIYFSSFIIRFLYQFIYFLFLGPTKRGFGVLAYIYLLHYVSQSNNIQYISSYELISINLSCWILQFLGHTLEKSRPALIDNFIETFIWAPLMPYMFFFKYFNYSYKTSIKFEKFITNKGNNKVICIGGLKQSMKSYISDDKIIISQQDKIIYDEVISVKILPGIDYNHSFVVETIYDYIQKNTNTDSNISFIGYSFGGAIGQKLSTKIKFNEIVLIAPSGFNCYTVYEKLFKYFSNIIFKITRTSIWKTFSEYPNYGLEQNFDTKLMKYNRLYIYYGLYDFMVPLNKKFFENVNTQFIKSNGEHLCVFLKWKKRSVFNKNIF
tara:strand:- start:1799 stop:2890 length:1092 start_codon:yes stop_codon:yes gene_type:complete